MQLHKGKIQTKDIYGTGGSPREYMQLHKGKIQTQNIFMVQVAVLYLQHY